MALSLSSASFVHNGAIPARHTCEGPDTSPPLTWTDVPAGTRSLVLIVDDPDAPDPAAPRMTWVHWVLYNIPPSASGLTEGIAPAALPAGTLAGVTDFKRTGWGGPCPPIGRHRYFFKLYALDTILPAQPRRTKTQVERAMAGHVLGQAELIGTYEKRKR
ncbi:MAG TPA: YbhB/YbcL family Raf kinase inhibitor-like protein [Gemmatimonadales bacterium]|jgi:Raf kinase inhibitor-like YbhB/YbcL family protein